MGTQIHGKLSVSFCVCFTDHYDAVVSVSGFASESHAKHDCFPEMIRILKPGKHNPKCPLRCSSLNLEYIYDYNSDSALVIYSELWCLLFGSSIDVNMCKVKQTFK